MDYKRVTKDFDPDTYKRIVEYKRLGLWICDSEDHNEPEGCSNPECFKYNKIERFGR